MATLKNLFVTKANTSTSDIESQTHLVQPKIESFPSGYPRFSALLGADPSFQIYRRFSYLRSRIILLKQDRLSVLEERLEALDREEESPIFLGSSRRDRNTERQAALSEIEAALSDYDNTIKKTSEIHHFDAAKPRHVKNIRNWIAGNACIARPETKFLDHDDDLLTISPPEDGTLSSLENLVEDALIYLNSDYYKNRYTSKSSDPNVYIPSASVQTHLARAILGLFVIILIIVPVLVCNSLSSITSRVIVIVVATSVFIAIMSGILRAKTVDCGTFCRWHCICNCVDCLLSRVVLKDEENGYQIDHQTKRYIYRDVHLKALLLIYMILWYDPPCCSYCK